VTNAPSCSNFLEIDSPIPLEPPVINTCFPAKDAMKFFFFLLLTSMSSDAAEMTGMTTTHNITQTY
jgi:hypothetical protein